MAKRAGGPIPNKYDINTEACPRMTRRWVRDVVPELAAWLRVHAARLERSITHAKQAAKANTSPEMRTAIGKLTVRLDIIYDLIRQTPDKWDEYLWWECCKDVEAIVNPQPVKPVHVPRAGALVRNESGELVAPTVTDGRVDAGVDTPQGDRTNQRVRRSRRAPESDGRTIPAGDDHS